MDGVIADTAQPHCRSWQYAFYRQGIKFTDVDFPRIFGKRNDTIIPEIMGKEVNQVLIDTISRDKEEHFRKSIVEELRTFPGVIDLLAMLKRQQIKAAIGSSAPLENIQIILNGLKIADYFQAVVYGLEVSQGKPNPAIFLKAAEKLQVAAADCIVIEDAVAGVTAAKRAGMACIAVTNSHPREFLAEADLVVDSLEKVRLEDLNQLFENNKQK